MTDGPIENRLDPEPVEPIFPPILTEQQHRTMHERIRDEVSIDDRIRRIVREELSRVVATLGADIERARRRI
jgi:hypothetical protein